MKSKAIDSSKDFIRKIHTGRDLRKGISRNRKLLNVNAIPAVVRDLNKSAIYSKNLILNPFPKKIEEIKRWFPLSDAGPTIEFVWTASILSLFINELNAFVALRDRFHDHYLVGKFDEASSVLDEIEALFGFSLWSIDARLRLLQRSQGLSAQKQFLESTISTEGIDPFTAYLFFYLSFSCEENVTTTDIARELDELESANVGATLVDYFTFRMNPLELTRVRTPSECLRTEENSPIIDRFETFVQMAQLELARSRGERPHHLERCFQLLKDLADPRCVNLGKILARDARGFGPYSSELEYCDEYTRGNYESLSETLENVLTETPGKISLYELAAPPVPMRSGTPVSGNLEYR
jgi:hypothetical protein